MSPGATTCDSTGHHQGYIVLRAGFIISSSYPTASIIAFLYFWDIDGTLRSLQI
jgi:hypothetical protein